MADHNASFRCMDEPSGGSSSGNLAPALRKNRDLGQVQRGLSDGVPVVFSADD